jgi:hypothetical protein
MIESAPCLQNSSTRHPKKKTWFSSTQRKAERLTNSCENCNLNGAEIPFDNILDRITGSDPSVTDYLLEAPRSVPIADARFSKRR